MANPTISIAVIKIEGFVIAFSNRYAGTSKKVLERLLML
jgi:hypothetical protein